MGFQDVAFQPSRASFSTTYVNNCCGGKGLRSATCLNTVVEVIKGTLLVKYFGSQKCAFCISEISGRLLLFRCSF